MSQWVNECVPSHKTKSEITKMSNALTSSNWLLEIKWLTWPRNESTQSRQLKAKIKSLPSTQSANDFMALFFTIKTLSWKNSKNNKKKFTKTKMWLNAHKCRELSSKLGASWWHSSVFWQPATKPLNNHSKHRLYWQHHF